MRTKVKRSWMLSFYAVLLLLALFHRNLLFRLYEAGWVKDLPEAGWLFACLGIELLLLGLFTFFFDRFLTWTEFKKFLRTALTAILIGGIVDYFVLELWPWMVLYVAVALIAVAVLWWLRWRREKRMRREMRDGGWM